MSKKIGFYIPDEDESKPEQRDSSVIILRKFIESIYSPTGYTEQKEFRSALELQYELRESMEVTITELNEILTSMGYELEFIEGMPHWVMYQKNSLSL